MNRIFFYLYIINYIIILYAIPVPPYPPPVDTESSQISNSLNNSNGNINDGTVVVVGNDNSSSSVDAEKTVKLYQEINPSNGDSQVGNVLNNSDGSVDGNSTFVKPGGSDYSENNFDSNNNGISNEYENGDSDPVVSSTSSQTTSTPTSESSHSPPSKPKPKEKGKENNKKSYKGYIIFVIVVFTIAIVLSIAIFIFKRKYVNEPDMPTRESTIGFKTGNLMEKIQAINMNNMNDMNNMNKINYNIDNNNNNVDPLINYSMASAMNTELNTSSIKNALEPNKDPEHYNKWYDSMKRGLKPPPSRDNNNNNNKKKKGTKVTGNGSPLTISTKSKSPDLTKSFKSASKDYSISRNSTDISGHTQTIVSHCSSNGGIYGYRNNKLNKHTSVAMTFGCIAEREDSYQELSSPSRSSNSPRISRISTSHSSSSRSLTSFISNSPITQNFKNRISSYFAGGGRRQISGYDSYRKNNDSDSYETSSRTTGISKNRSPYMSGAEYGNVASKKSLNKIDTSVRPKNNKDMLISPTTATPTTATPTTANTPVENGYDNSTSTEHLIEKQDILNSFLYDKDKPKLELSFLNDRNNGKLDLSFNYGK